MSDAPQTVFPPGGSESGRSTPSLSTYSDGKSPSSTSSYMAAPRHFHIPGNNRTTRLLTRLWLLPTSLHDVLWCEGRCVDNVLQLHCPSSPQQQLKAAGVKHLNTLALVRLVLPLLSTEGARENRGAEELQRPPPWWSRGCTEGCTSSNRGRNMKPFLIVYRLFL